MFVDDILFEKDVTSYSPLGEDGSAVNIMSAKTSSSGSKPFPNLASLIMRPPLPVSLVKTHALISVLLPAIPIGS